MEWISVKDRLPEDNVDVLVYEPINYVIKIANSTDGKFQTNMWDERTYELVTHWMPLPEKPNE